MCLGEDEPFDPPCDRHLLAAILKSMYNKKLDALKERKADFLFRVYKTMEPSVLAGSIEDRLKNAWPTDESIDEFLARFRLPQNPCEPDGSGSQALQWAASLGHAGMVSKLIHAKCSADISDNGGLTPLIVAASSCQPMETVRILLDEWGLDNDAINKASKKFGITALNRAAKRGQVDVVKLLVGRRASLAARRDDGRTPLLSAAEMGHYQVCKTLLELRACVEDVGHDGQGVLHLVARPAALVGGSPTDVQDVVKLFLEAHVDPWQTDKNGHRAIHIAKTESSSQEVEQLLSEAAKHASL